MLDMSAIEQQQMKVAGLPLDMNQMLEPIITIYNRQCQLKAINLKSNKTTGQPAAFTRGW